MCQHAFNRGKFPVNNMTKIYSNISLHVSLMFNFIPISIMLIMFMEPHIPFISLLNLCTIYYEVLDYFIVIHFGN